MFYEIPPNNQASLIKGTLSLVITRLFSVRDLISEKISFNTESVAAGRAVAVMVKNVVVIEDVF